MTATASSIKNAFAKAAKLGTARTVKALGDGRYFVPSASAIDGCGYFVTVVTLDDVRCNCKAGEHGCPCYHGAGVVLYRAAVQAFAPAGPVIPTCTRCSTRPVRTVTWNGKQQPAANGLCSNCDLWA